MATYLFQKRGVYYFERRIPKDVRPHYSANKIIKSLRTKNRRIANTMSLQMSSRLDLHWASLRVQDFAPVSRQVITDENEKSLPTEIDCMTFSQAAELYLHLKGKERDKRFKAYAKRAVGYLLAVAEDKKLSSYDRDDANALRDSLAKRGLVRSSVKRNLEVVRAIFNIANREKGYNLSNPFSNVLMSAVRAGSKRLPLNAKELDLIKHQCLVKDDEMRWLVALIADTGMRLAEACGLLIDDINIDCNLPHIFIRNHNWRRLKTDKSERQVPLVGSSLWAAKRLVENASNEFCFPKYCNAQRHKADSASNALNKWMRPYVREGCVIHSFRHSIRDRLRDVECPSDLVDEIGGWKSAGVGQQYGQGTSLSVKQKWLAKIC